MQNIYNITSKINKSKILTVIIVFIAAVIGSFALLSISNLFFSTYTTYIMSAFWMVIVLIEFYLTLSVAKTKSESFLLSGALITRLIYLLYSKWGFAINKADLSSDALGFWKTAEQYYSRKTETVYNLFPYFICGEFYIWGKNLFCCLLFNVFLSYLSCAVFLAVLNRFDLKNKTRIISLSIVSFLPYSLIESSQLIREPLYYFFIICSFYFFVDYIFTSKTRSLYFSLVSLIPALLFHIGFFPIMLVYMLAAVIRSYKNGRLIKPAVVLHILLFITLICLIINFESMDYLIGNDVDHLYYFMDKLSGIINHKSLMEANSAYLLDLKMDSWWKFLLISPIKLLYFLFSPLPPYWYSVKQIISFLLDSIVHMLIIGCVVFCCIKYKNKLSKTKEAVVICYGILAFIAVCFVFALGTSNSGTAIRHRDVFIGIEAVIFALCFDRIESFKIPGIRLDNKKFGLILIPIIVIQVHFLIYTGAQKQEFHIDEIYSYTISNSYNSDGMSNDDRIWNTWISGDDLHKYLTVQEGEGFAYSTVYRNNSSERSSPPLYSWLLHTACSFTTDSFSKWSGLSMNIILFAITAFLIYLISDEIFVSKKFKYLPLIIWGFSGFAVDTCIFIRMYMLQTAITACFVYLHIRMFRHGVTIRRMVFVWVTVFLGAMTHYYSLVLIIWGALFFSAYLLRRKEIKNAIIYGTGICLSVIAMIWCCPYVFQQLIESYATNDYFDLSLWYCKTKDLIYTLASGITYSEKLSLLISGAILLLIIVYIFLMIKSRISADSGTDTKDSLWMAGIIFLTFVCVTILGGNDVSIRYIYFTIPFSYIVIIKIIEKLLSDRKMNSLLSNAAFMIAIVFAFSNAAYGTSTDSSTYLYKGIAYQVNRISTYSELPLLVITENDTSTAVTGNLRAFEAFENIYMSSMENLVDDFIMTDRVLENSPYVMYITVDKYCPDGYGYDLDATLNDLLTESGAEYEYITKGRYGEYFYVHK